MFEKGYTPWNKGMLGFNKGKLHPLYGTHPSQTTIDKISKSLKGRVFSNEHKQKLKKSRKQRVPPMLGKKFTLDHRKKLSLINMGPNNPNWKGGIQDINNKIKTSMEYKEWRKKVFERDNYTCQDCGKKGIYLHPHHIKPFCLFPKLRFVVSNGKTLCVKCHMKTDTYGAKMTKLIKIYGQYQKS